MYEVSANINDVEVRKAPLLSDFQPDLDTIAREVDENTKMIFICSPNNPTGNSIDRSAIETILSNFSGLVVIDEAYINYSRYSSFIRSEEHTSELQSLMRISYAVL